MNYLQVFDKDNNLLKSFKLPGKFTQIRKSNKEEIFIGSKDTLYQVFYRNDTFKIINPVEISEFEDFQKKWFYIDKNIHFKEVREYPKSEYPTLVYELHAFYDASKKKSDKVVYSLADAKSTKIPKGRQTYPNRDKRITYQGGAPQQSVTYPSMWATMFKHDSTYYFIDIAHDEIVYINHSLTYEKTIAFEKKTDKFYGMDYANGNIYCISNFAEGEFLFGFDKETGKVIKSKRTTDWIYMQDPRIYNNRIYFLSRLGKDSHRTLVYLDL